MAETKITARSTMTDAYLELYRSFFDQKKNKYLSEIQDSAEADIMASEYVLAKLFNDDIAKDFLDLRVQQMLTLDRKNAKMLVDLVKTHKKDEDEEPDQNIGVKKELEKLFSNE